MKKQKKKKTYKTKGKGEAPANNEKDQAYYSINIWP